METELQICQNIQQIRLSRKLSQQFVADKLGIQRTTYANWEGNTEPSVTIIKSLAGIFQVHYVQIIDGIAADFRVIKELSSENQRLLTTAEISDALRVLSEAVKKIQVNSDDTGAISESSQAINTQQTDPVGQMGEFLDTRENDSTVKKRSKKGISSEKNR